MPTVIVTQPSDGQTADANDVNSQVNAILAVVNGHVDQDNLADGGVTNAKLAGSIDVSKLATNVGAGWIPGLATPNTVTYNGNRNYSLVFNGTDLTSTLSNGMRLKLTRTVTAPTQSTSLNGTTQYYNKTSPAGTTFTDNFTCMAWIKLAAYGSAPSNIITRGDAALNNGWRMWIDTSGRVSIAGYSGGVNRAFLSNQSVPLNKWVHVAATLNMSGGTSTMYLDGASVTTATFGGAGTSLTQAGDLVIGQRTGPAANEYFNGKIAQAAVFSAVLSAGTIASYVSQGLAGSETSLISAYSFNNAVTDLNANANTLTANGSAVATNADSPFAGGANASTAYTAGTTEFGEVFNVSFSTNTTAIVQVPDGYAIPTSGGVSAVAYSTQASPLGWPGLGSVIAQVQLKADFAANSNSVDTDLPGAVVTFYCPAGRRVKIEATAVMGTAAVNTLHLLKIKESTTQLAEGGYQDSAANIRGASIARDVITPTAGSHTYKVQFYSNQNATTTVYGTYGQGGPNLFTVELEPLV